MDTEQWREQLQVDRRQKDWFFGSHPQSPIRGRHVRGFSGLRYWPPDPRYRFELALDVHREKRVVEVGDTAGYTRKLLRWGEFRFAVEDSACVLQAYRHDADQEGLFVPFRDTTCGRESYGSGRYLDLEPLHHLTPSGEWILDFNQAYNPWCAYGDSFSCPFVPPENWLSVPIHAGEKSYES